MKQNIEYFTQIAINVRNSLPQDVVLGQERIGQAGKFSVSMAFSYSGWMESSWPES